MSDNKLRPIFTCDLEDWNHSLHISKGLHSSAHSVYWLQYKLDQYKVRAIFYVLRKFDDEVIGMVSALRLSGHVIKTHGMNHFRDENADRKPYSFLGFAGGFWFRFLPYWWIKTNVIRKGMFYIHPHDLDEEHPKLKNPLLNWKRHVGLKNSRVKLERLLREVEFGDPKTYSGN